MVSVISFDLNGTLVDRYYADYFWLELIPQIYAEEHGVSFEEAYSYVISEYDRIGPDNINWYLPEYWIRHFHLNVSLEELIERTLSKVMIYPEVPEVLRELGRDFILVISSNTSIEFIDAILEKIYAEVGYRVFSRVFSCVTDMYLPRKEVRFYEYIYRSLQVPPHSILHVGDDLKYDYEIPRSVGMRACLVDRRGELDPSLQVALIRNLKELPKLLSTI